MNPVDLIKLKPLFEQTSGRPDLRIGLIDGPVSLDHPDLARDRIHEIHTSPAACTRTTSAACAHGTFIAGILAARRGSPAPSICPGCTLLVRPVFTEAIKGAGPTPATTPEELATAIIDCVASGVRIINLSLSLIQRSPAAWLKLEEALDHAARRSVIVVVAAGNEGRIASSAATRHPWVIPVVAFDGRGVPMDHSNLGGSLGKRGVGAPGENVTSLGSQGAPLTLSGTSVAAAFVTGAIALLWSEFPNANAAEMKNAITKTYAGRRRGIVPPLLNAWEAYLYMCRMRINRWSA